MLHVYVHNLLLTVDNDMYRVTVTTYYTIKYYYNT